ncbi:hypothetical protein ACF0H5_000597 [Mactra antiquata]
MTSTVGAYPPPPQYNPQQPGYNPANYGQPAYGQAYPTNVTVITQPGQPGNRAPGTCPYCGLGTGRSSYTMLGLLIAFCFFPLGVICCLMMTERRCTNCNGKF